MKNFIIRISISSLLIFAACITDSADDDSYEIISLQFEKTLTGEIDQIFYNGYMRSNNRILDPYETSEDGFYIVESPEMLDSIFQEVNYPGIDTLFPENGVLVIFNYYLIFRHELTDNVVFFTDSTLKVHLTIRDWDMLTDPGVWEFVFPVGITFK